MQRGVVLYNHASGTGHHESWTAMVATLLVERGYRVACITPDPAALESVLRSQGVTPSEGLCLLAMPEIIPPPMTLHQRVMRLLKGLRYRQRSGDSGRCSDRNGGGAAARASLLELWRSRAYSYAHHIPEVRITADLPVRIKLKRSLLHVFVPPVWYLQQGFNAVAHFYSSLTWHAGNRYPANLALAARTALEKLPWKPDFLLVMYADIWMTKPSFWRPSVVRMPLPWGAIRFAPLVDRHVRAERYFTEPMFRGLCFLDEDAVGCYRARCPQATFAFLPDIVNSRLPDGPVMIAEEIRRRAAGRPVVLLCGSIEGRKNPRLFCEMANRSEASLYFFAIIGQIQTSSFSQNELDALDAFAASTGGNTFFRDVFFEDEREMNAVIAASDILFAVYRNFSISSNMLGKAASFRKPILVSDRYLMGRRVREYGIGRTVAEDDAGAMLKELQDLIDHRVPEENFSRYQKEFSSEQLAENLDSFLRRCIRKASRRYANKQC